MIYTLDRILEKTRFQSSQNTYSSSMSEAVEVSFIDDAQDLIATRLLEYRPDMLSTYVDISLTGAERYYLPDSVPYEVEQVLFAENITDTSSPLPSIPTDWWDRLSFINNEIIPEDEVWSIRDKYIEFPRKPTGETWRIWLSRKPTGLLSGTAAGGSSTTIIFPTTNSYGDTILKDDYYIGMSVYCNNEVKLITDYVSSTKTATVSGTWTTTPTNAHSMSLISSLPTVLHSLISTVAAMYIRGTANDDPIEGINALIEDTFLKHIKRLSTAQKQTAKQITRVQRY